MSNFLGQIATLSAEKRELFEALLSESGGEFNAFPLSFAQQRLWFLDQFQPNSALYNIPAAVRIEGALDVAALEKSINAIVRRHEALRTTFVAVGGYPIQVIAPVLTIECPMVALDLIESEAQVQRLVKEVAQQAFELSSGPLLRARLLRLSDAEHVLILIWHHIIADGWSLGVFMRELAALYDAFVNGKEALLPDLPIQYADFAVWQRQWLQDEVLEEQLAYWREKLGGKLPPLELPTDRPRPFMQTFQGACQAVVLSESLTAALRALSQRQGVTLFMTLLAAFQTLLHRYTGQDDVLVGSPIANRSEGETEGLIGFFVNTLVLRTDLSGDPTFLELLQRVQQVAWGAYAHQDLPFEKLVEELQPARDMSHAPLFQVMFSLQNAPMPAIELSDLSLTLVDVHSGTAKFDLTLDLAETAQGLRGWLEYNVDLFDASTAARIAGHLKTLLQDVVANPDQRLSKLCLLTNIERHQLLVRWNDTGFEHPKEQCIHQLFEAQAEKNPQAVAIVWGQDRLTYSQLNRRANQLAHYLQKLGVTPEVRVGISMARSLEMVIGILGVLKAGGAYVPLDPTYPQERLSFMLLDTQSPVLLTQQLLVEQLPVSSARVVCLDSDWALIARESDGYPISGITDSNLAYIIYTSGSTGRPKGVAISHRNAAALLYWSNTCFPFEDRASVLALTSICFDLSIFELFLPLCCGGQVILAQNALQWPTLPAAQEVVLVNTVPSAMTELVRMGIPGPVRMVNLAGEPLQGRLVEQLYQYDHIKQVCNLYGPSEDTTYSTFAWVRRDSERTPPIGRPVNNSQVYLLDVGGELVPVGMPGELYMGGEGLARGYLARPQLTAERFVPNPFSGEPGTRLYRTGDLARYFPDGELEFLGRIDHQVKIRGFRIELGEVESALCECPTVEEAVVLAQGEVPGEQRLVAYLVSSQIQTATVNELRSFLKTRLPEYMVPSAFVMLNALPLTPNGKVDRRALPAPDPSRPELDGVFVAPRTPVEEVLAALWAQLLKVEQVGVYDDFFALGGHSLLATQLFSRLREVLKIELPLRSLFEARTVAGLAEQVEAATIASSGLQAIPLRPVSRDGELPLSFAQERLWFLDRMKPGTFAYNMPLAMRFSGLLDVNVLRQSLNEVIRRHNILRATFPTVAGHPVQVIAPVLTVLLPVVDLQGVSASERKEQCQQIATQEAQRPFDLAKGPLLRATMLRMDDQEHVLLLTIHHIVSDGWSNGVITREVVSLYEAYYQGKPSPLSDLPIQYSDFVEWQRTWLQGEVLERQLSYWKQHLGGELPVLELPTDQPWPADQTMQGDYQVLLLPAPLTRAIRTLGRQEGSTLFMVLLAAFKILLCRYTGQKDIIVGTPIAGRNQHETEWLVGCFINTLALRTDLSDTPSFQELLRRVREVALGAYAHQDLPFEKLVEELKPTRDLNRNPIFDVMLNLINTPPVVLEIPGVRSTLLDLIEPESKFAMTLYATEQDDTIGLRLVYRCDLFSAQRMVVLLAQFQYLLEQIVTAPRRSIDDYSLVTPILQAVLPDPGVALPEPRYKLVIEEFASWVERLPQQTAIFRGDQNWTYSELSGRAQAIAWSLHARGIQRGDVVAVFGPRSLGLIAGMLGVFLSGGVLLTLDPSLPSKRQQIMLSEAQAKHLLYVQSEKAQDAWLDQVGFLSMMRLDPDNGYPVNEEILVSEAPELPALAYDDAAYIFFTSGTTAVPKGVLGSHKGLAHFLCWQRTEFGIGPHDRFAQLTALSFDVVLRDILTPLTSGATICLPEDDIYDPNRIIPWLERAKISALHTVPALVQVWLAGIKPGASLRHLRSIFFAGEPLKKTLIDQWRATFPDAGEIVNLYGPTETTLAKCFYRVPADPLPGIQPVGTALPETQALVLADNNRLCGVGETGEIVLRTPFRSLGYINATEENRSCFAPNPFRDDQEDLLYYTRDRGRYRPDGLLEILGRLDHQVKIRGARVELGEVEIALTQHPLVQEAVVVTRDDQGDVNEKQLVAYVVLNQAQTVTVSELRHFLRERLPEYMMPSAFVILGALPLTPHGKVDRHALPEPDTLRPQLESVYIAPRGELERAIAAIWQEVLGIENVGVHDSFFDLGGHSLLLIQVQNKLKDALNIDVSAVDLFKYPTISTLARYLSRDVDKAPLARYSHERALVYGATGSQQVTEIAIIGMSGRFPGAKSIDEFWRNLCEGVESISFFSDEELIASGVDSHTLDDSNYVRARGIIEGVEMFDASFFGFNPREAEVMDPQHRLFLECAHQALEDASCNPEKYPGPIGIYAGTFMSTYLPLVYSNSKLLQSTGELVIRHGNEKDYLTTRTAYKLGLTGPCVSVQTACSTSLVATHMACQALLSGDCRVALVGGVSIRTPQKVGYHYQQGDVLSPDGHCRAFDVRAQGTVFSDSIGIVVLKRLADALADGDQIYAVIKGSAVNNDGSLRAGYTAPSVDGQTEVIARALAVSQIPADTIGYVETHGTGTELGDPIEITALTQAFRAHTDGKGYCAIGSVKTNIGHPSTASGVVGLIKAALTLHHKMIPPSLHFEAPNPKIDFANSPFYVNAHLLEWKADGTPRRAGVSSFGFGGTNAHIVLEEAPVADPSGPSRPWQLLLLSAKTESALETVTDNLANHLQQHPHLNLADVAHTLKVGRKTFDHRRMLVCREIEDAIQALEARDPKRILTSFQKPHHRPPIFMFPGQGAQYVNMALGLYQSEPVFCEHVDRCSEILQPFLELDLRSVLYPEQVQSEKAAQQLQQTRITQPALFAIEYALAQLWMAWGLYPEAMIGHSIGEYVAACLAGVFSLQDALTLVAVRGRLMQELPGGAMLSVSLAEQELDPLLDKALSLAAVNGPSLCVISGPTDAIEALERQLLDQDVACRRLYTSHAFHSKMMEPILEPFLAQVKQIALNPPQIPYLSNVTGAWITAAEATEPNYWVKHLRRPVRFAGGLCELLKEATWLLLEVGPGQTLSALAKRHPDRATEQIILASLPHPRDPQPDGAFILNTLGRLWLAGAQIDWIGFYAHERRRHLSLPAYPFERQRYWVETSVQTGERFLDRTATGESLSKKLDVADWFYIPSWKRTMPLVSSKLGDWSGACWLIFADECGLGAKVAQRLAQSEQKVVVVEKGEQFAGVREGVYTLNPSRPQEYDALLKELDQVPQKILHLWSVTANDQVGGDEFLEEAQYIGFYSLLFLAQALDRQNVTSSLQIEVVSNSVQEVDGQEELCPEKATVLGPCKVIPQEYPNITCQHIDIVVPEPQSSVELWLVNQLVAELATEPSDAVVAYRGKHRWVQTFEPIQLDTPADGTTWLRPQGVYLITGGLGHIGLALAEYLAETVQAKLALLERSTFPKRHEWTERAALDDDIGHKIQKLQAIEALGADFLVIDVDITDKEQMRVALARVHEHFGEIDGVIHAAGIIGEIAYCPVSKMGRTESSWYFDPKVYGLSVLKESLRKSKLDFCLLLSSLSSILGGLGLAACAATDCFVEAFAYAQNRTSTIPWINVNWDSWQHMEQSDAPKATVAELALTPQEGVMVFRHVLSTSAVTQLVVSTGDLQARIEQWINPSARKDERLAVQDNLSTLHPRPNLPNVYIPTSNELEQRIAAIWQRVLGIDQVGIYDNFFDLGGDSVIALQLVSGLNRELAVQISAVTLFEAPTVSALAEYLNREQGEQTTLQDSGERAETRRKLMGQREQLRQRIRMTSDLEGE